jgi:undecaprenyl-diphosphatase
MLRRMHSEKGVTVLYVWKALVIGTAQGVALIPGISRSGATIATGLLCGLGSNLAFRFSFLLLLPATIGAAIFKLKYITGPEPPFLHLMVGSVVAFLTGLFALNVLSKVLRMGRVYIFGLYCMVLGLIILFLK